MRFRQYNNGSVHLDCKQVHLKKWGIKDPAKSESQMTADNTDYADDSESFRMSAFKKQGDFRSAPGEKPLQAVIPEASA